MEAVKPLGTQLGCIDAAARILGDKWTPLLLRYFINEPVVRFCSLQDFVDGINPRTLSARLDRLESEGIITRHSHDTSSRCEYRLTRKGRDLLPILQSMQAWSQKYTPSPLH